VFKLKIRLKHYRIILNKKGENMAEDVLEKTEKEVKRAEKWVAAEFAYMKKVKADLDAFKKEIGTPEARKDVRKAKRDFTWVGRGEYRAGRFEENVIKSLDELKDMVPEEFKAKIEGIENDTKIATANLAKHSSRFAGELRNKLNKLEAGEKALEAIEDLQSKGKAKPAAVEAQKKKVQDRADDVISHVDDMLKWMTALEVDLKNAEQFEAQIKAWLRS